MWARNHYIELCYIYVQLIQLSITTYRRETSLAPSRRMGESSSKVGTLRF
jgi:hypothetical protein